MPITHAKTSAIADSGNAALVEPSDWNASHIGSNGFDLSIGPWPEHLLATGAGVAFPIANAAVIQAFTVFAAHTVQTAYFRVAAQSGNMDVGIYSDAGTRLGSSGTVAVPVVQNTASRAMTGTVSLVPGVRYWAAIACDNTTAAFSTGPNVVAGMTIVPGYPVRMTVATSFVLPSSITIGDGTNGTTANYCIYFV